MGSCDVLCEIGCGLFGVSNATRSFFFFLIKKEGEEECSSIYNVSGSQPCLVSEHVTRRTRLPGIAFGYVSSNRIQIVHLASSAN